MKICLVAENLLPGGVEWFILRLFREFSKKGHKVDLVVVNPQKIDNRLISRFPEVNLIFPPKNITRFCNLLDKGFNRIFGKTFFHSYFISLWLKRYLVQNRPDVIHSHFLGTDKIVVFANKNIGIRHIITMHGDYSARIKRKMHKYYNIMRDVLEKVDQVVVISEEQKEVVTKKYPFVKSKMVKIYNGYSTDENVDSLKSGENFTFGLIGRSVPEKGWEVAIQAFQKINRPNIRLVFYGEGEYLTKLLATYTDNRIVFAGLTNMPLKAISSFDVGLFPSYYSNESLPTTVIEYLLLHKPVFTTAVGECAYMIEDEGQLAGKIIPMKDDLPCVDSLSQMMEQIIDDKTGYNKMVEVAAKAKLKFNMEACIQKYTRVYQNKPLNTAVLVTE